jgi:AmmeMemoRadiSam system protein A
MTATERGELLAIARDAIRAALEGRAFEAAAGSASLDVYAGAFVTLHTGGDLRGCIGQIEPNARLRDVVARCAVSAATRDPRFPPLTLQDLSTATEIEISVLTPLERVTSVEEIAVGRDGLYVVQGPASGLLLPQVATEWRWDRDTFLAQTCRKADLAPDAWKRGAEIYRFQAEIFSEHDR